MKSAWEAILKGESGIGPIVRFDVSAFPVRFGGAVRGFDVSEYIPSKDARRMDEFMHYGVAAGMQGHLAKPLRLRDLAAAISRWTPSVGGAPATLTRARSRKETA